MRECERRSVVESSGERGNAGRRVAATTFDERGRRSSDVIAAFSQPPTCHYSHQSAFNRAMLSPASRSCHARSRELLQQCCLRGSRAISTNSAIARGLRATSAAERRRYPGNKSRPLFRKELERYDLKRARGRGQSLQEKHGIQDREARLESTIRKEEGQTRGVSGW